MKAIGHTTSREANWLFGRRIDLLFLYTPVWIIWLFFFVQPADKYQFDLPLWAWVVFVLGFDVSHVWSTLFRTYLDREEREKHRQVLYLAPLVLFCVVFFLSSYSMDFFWRLMAYFAVFHFVKQQYGFLALYGVKNGSRKWKKIISDKVVIYLATLYPVFFWHVMPNREFRWFTEHDFVFQDWDITAFLNVFNVLYWLVVGAWLVEEMRLNYKHFGRIRAWGKIAWVLTTAVNWYFGIVYYNSDVVFSVSNVVAHGLPYMVLILFYGQRKREIKAPEKRYGRSFFLKSTSVFLGLILLLAFMEEYFWDVFINRQHRVLFEYILPYPEWSSTGIAIPFVTALLALPQLTHYVLDGFIWKANDRNPYLKLIFK